MWSIKIHSKPILSLTFLLILSITTFAQVPIGHWRDHFPYATMIDVQASDKKVFASSEKALVVYNKEDNSIERLTKINALSDIGISVLNYNALNNNLIIGYSNGNVDILNDNTVINIPDIKRSSIIGKKQINNIFSKDNLVYLSCGFGIVVLDLVKVEVKDTYFLKDTSDNPIVINDLAFHNNHIYVATEENGIYKAPANSPNLSNFSVWKNDTSISNSNKSFSHVEAVGSRLFAAFRNDDHGSDSTYVHNGISWETYAPISGRTVVNLRSSNNKLIFVGSYYVKVLDEKDNKEIEVKKYDFTEEDPEPLAASINNGELWVADDFFGLIRADGDNARQLFTSGPFNSKAVNLVSYKNKLWVAPNPLGKQNDKDGIFLFSDEKWTNYHRALDPQFDTLRAIVDININPNDPTHIFASSWRDGLFEIKNGQFIANYRPENSTLQHHPQDKTQVIVGASRFDNDGNLWVTNSNVSTPISVRTSGGKWIAYNFNGDKNLADKALRGFIMDFEGQKWIIVDGTGILVFKDQGTVTNHADDNYIVLNSNTGQGGLPSREVKSMALDKDGEVWVGTHKGVAVFYDPSRIFSGEDFDAQEVLIDQGDGTAKALLESEIITAITVDGSNRKWIGTLTSGVFLMSEDGTKELKVFNTKNSPLLSNTINDIEINEETGEVFIATERGIMSYRGTATGGEKNKYSEVLAFPNPVKENYSGPIAIKGLIRNSDVKITDINGNIVYHTKSFGGQAIWNGQNISGQKVAPGVYVVLSVTEEGEESIATKILIMN